MYNDYYCGVIRLFIQLNVIKFSRVKVLNIQEWSTSIEYEQEVTWSFILHR